MLHPVALTDIRLHCRSTVIRGSRALFVEYRVCGHRYYGMVLRQCDQLLHVYPPALSVLSIVEPDHHDTVNLGWEDYEFEFETGLCSS